MVLVAEAPIHAQTPVPALTGYRHDSWTSFSGAPSSISQIIEAPDGWLWLASSKGLFRFDGASFERIEAPRGSTMENAPATALLVTRSGELWIGYGANGGIAVFRKGALQVLPMLHRPYAVVDMVQTRDGAIWAMSHPSDYPDSRLQRYANGHWEEHADRRLRLVDGAPWNMCISADGTLWAQLGHVGGMRLVPLRPGAKQFEGSFVGWKGIRCYRDQRGAIWRAGRTIQQVVNSDGSVPSVPPTLGTTLPDSVGSFAFDGLGNFWGASLAGKGLYHISAQRPGISGERIVRRFAGADGLSSDVVTSIYVDRSQNIWVGTEAGLDRFRPAAVIQEAALPGEPSAGMGLTLLAGRAVVGTNAGLFDVLPGNVRRTFVEENWGQCPAWSGGIWLLFPTRVVHLRGVQQTVFARPKDWILTSECVEDRLGRLWVGDIQGKLYWHDAAGWHRPARDLPKLYQWDMVRTPQGNLAYVTKNALVRLVGDRVITTSLVRYAPGALSLISAGQRDLFVSGSKALLRYRDGKLSRIDGARVSWVTSLRGIAETPQGDVWFMDANSLSRVNGAELDRAFAGSAAPLTRTLLDARDGVRPMQEYNFRGMQLAADATGRLWQLNRAGLAYVDPSGLEVRKRAPPVFITSIEAASLRVRDPSSTTLSPGTTSIHFGYTALNFASPERIRFRYRLADVDPSWSEPTDRRIASFENMGPGRYRFFVIASEDQKTWSPPATLYFEVKPTFVQSWPFKLLCGVVLLILGWQAYSMRLRAVANRIRERLSERSDERERIARELHDTLLQSVQMLTLRFQLAVDSLPQKAPERQTLEDAIDGADNVIAEARDRVRNLRTKQNADVCEVIESILSRQGFDSAVRIEVATEGKQVRLKPHVMEEVARIASEAIFNIWRHADAGQITVSISHGREFSLTIGDDGRGIDQNTIDRGVLDGHYGLAGMNERARKLHGRLHVRRREESGTEIQLIVPGRIAYETEGSMISHLRGLWQWIARSGSWSTTSIR
ncbi:sensor histidine kinase [Flavisphingomonas formosensis]|uniref:sensor histidine kinase n=1 Tax=Flavisphingomonas formosensis TaxID=861534 RepID=UPI0018DF2CFC|nr:sensor histidine kinase [Sphingomonas formosensis]